MLINKYILNCLGSKLIYTNKTKFKGLKIKHESRSNYIRKTQLY